MANFFSRTTTDGERYFQILFDLSPDPAWIIVDRHFVECNQAAVTFLGYPDKTTLTNTHPSELSPEFQPDGESSFSKAERLMSLTREKGMHRFDWMHRRADGSTFLAEVTLCLIHLNGNELIYCVWRDITEVRQARRELQNSLQRFSITFEACPLAASISDHESGRFIEVNPSYQRVFGWGREDLIGRTSLEVGFWPTPQMRADWVKAMDQAGRLVDYEMSWVHKDGSLRIVSMSSEVIDLEGRPCILAYLADITERKAAEGRIKALAYCDQLTGLPNRFSLTEQISQMVRLAARSNLGFVLMLLDLDNFKSINDSLGHHVGDALLVQVAQRLQVVVDQCDMIGRFGGDEFVILISDIALPIDAAHIAQVADKILAALTAPFVAEQHELRTSPSIGICCYPDDATNGLDLIQKADAAMYQAKARGRNQYQFFQQEYQQEAQQRLTLESDLRNAITARQFVLYYQPQLDLASAAIYGVEALIRWQHPQRGLVAPGEFIQVCEETGMIEPISQWVLEEACRQMADWQTQGMPRISVSVNMTASQFLDPQLPARVRALLTRYGIAAGTLCLEVTESMAMHNAEQTIASMQELVACGLRLAIDDFGTGYSSLSHLKNFPVHTLKIDRSFVKDIETDPNDADICDVTVLLAHKLGMDVVAEGVETMEQLTYLRSIGCEKIQGYLISKPLPATVIDAFIRNYLIMTPTGSIELWDGPTEPGA